MNCGEKKQNSQQAGRNQPSQWGTRQGAHSNIWFQPAQF